MSQPEDKVTVRLPTDVVPVHYDLTIKTDIVNRHFSGVATIEINVLKPVSSITLNAALPLHIRSALLITDSLLSSQSKKAKIEVDSKRERAILSFGEDVAKGKHKLAVRWGGKLDESMKGYYLSPYPTKGGKETSYFAVTQFQPTSARRAFPCFDEPGYKATFRVSLISRTGTVSLSNAGVASVKPLGHDGDFPRSKIYDELLADEPQADDEEKGDPEKTLVSSLATDELVDNDWVLLSHQDAQTWELVEFHPMPKMSTYLVAFANGDLEHTESSFTSVTGRKVPIRFYATWDCVSQTRLALDTTAKLVPLYEKIFDIPFPLAKLDTLVVGGFDLGAMENWGLICGRTSVYLWEPESGLAAKKNVISVTSHELSHQWFGNVVTMLWWDSLWLNESFATLVGEVLLIDEIEPSWQIHSSFISDHLARALSLDALRSSHPIEMACKDESAIQQSFDSISYSKGGSVLAMLSSVIGQKTFLEGVTIYLKAHLYGNGTTADLWAGIAKSSGRDVAKLMDSWTNKIGFPVLTVEEVDGGINVRQSRFLASGDPTPAEDETIWEVPLQLITIKDGKASVDSEAFLSQRENFYPLPEGASFKLNSNTTGVYRTLYSPERFAKLGDEASKADSAFSLSDRMGLVQDASVLASAGYARTSSALTLISKLKDEKANLVWSEIASALGGLSATWWEQPEDQRKGLAELRRSLFAPVVERLGWEYEKDEDPDVTELRTTAISVAAACDDPEILKEFKRRFGLLLEHDDDSAIPSDLRSSIYRNSVRLGGEKEYKKVLDLYRSPPTPAHKLSAMAALGEPRDPALIRRTLALTRTEEVKTSDVRTFYSYIAANPVGKRAMWDFFKEHYDEIIARLTGNFLIGSVVRVTFASLTTEEDAQSIVDFFADKDTGLYDQSYLQGLEAVRSSIAWLKRDAEDVKTWLAENELL